MSLRLVQPTPHHFTPSSTATDEENRSRWKWLLGLCALACFSRVLMLLKLGPLCCNDAYYYLQVAAAVGTGDLELALAYLDLNLYPHLLAAMHRLGLEWVFAGQLLGIVTATLVILPLYGWTRRFFNETVAKASAFLYAVHPELIELSVEPIREQTFWLLASLAIYWGWRSIETHRLRHMLAAGIATALAIHTRSEGWLLLLPMGIWLLADWWHQRRSFFQITGHGLVWAAMTPAAIVLMNVTLLTGHSGWHWGRLTHFQDAWNWAQRQLHATPTTVETTTSFRSEFGTDSAANASHFPQSLPKAPIPRLTGQRPDFGTLALLLGDAVPAPTGAEAKSPRRIATSTTSAARIGPTDGSPVPKDMPPPIRFSGNPNQTAETSPEPPRQTARKPSSQQATTADATPDRSQERPRKLTEIDLYLRGFVNVLEPVNLILTGIGLLWTLRIQAQAAYAGLTAMAFVLLAAIAVLFAQLGMTNARYFLTVYLVSVPLAAVGGLVIIRAVQTFVKNIREKLLRKSRCWEAAILPIAVFGICMLGWADSLSTHHEERQSQAAAGQSLQARFGPFDQVVVDQQSRRIGYFAADDLASVLPFSGVFPTAEQARHAPLIILSAKAFAETRDEQLDQAALNSGYTRVSYDAPPLAAHRFHAFVPHVTHIPSAPSKAPRVVTKGM